jgi:hypothetical protein
MLRQQQGRPGDSRRAGNVAGVLTTVAEVRALTILPSFDMASEGVYEQHSRIRRVQPTGGRHISRRACPQRSVHAAQGS